MPEITTGKPGRCGCPGIANGQLHGPLMRTERGEWRTHEHWSLDPLTGARQTTLHMLLAAPAS